MGMLASLKASDGRNRASRAAHSWVRCNMRELRDYGNHVVRIELGNHRVGRSRHRMHVHVDDRRMLAGGRHADASWLALRERTRRT